MLRCPAVRAVATRTARSVLRAPVHVSRVSQHLSSTPRRWTSSQLDATSTIVIGHPTGRFDPQGMFALSASSSLEQNSSYVYKLFGRHFNSTCVVAKDVSIDDPMRMLRAAMRGHYEGQKSTTVGGGTGQHSQAVPEPLHLSSLTEASDHEDNDNVVGFVLGFCVPEHPDTLFVWQIIVAESARGKGVGGRLLDFCGLIDGIRRIETTIAPSNEASVALFESFARRSHSPMTITRNWILPSEDRFEIGPLGSDDSS